MTSETAPRGAADVLTRVAAALGGEHIVPVYAHDGRVIGRRTTYVTGPEAEVLAAAALAASALPAGSPDCIFDPPGDCISLGDGLGCRACTPERYAPDVDALLAEDDAFGDANGAIRTALIGRAAAMDAAGRVVTIERCYASGLAQAAIRALRDLREAQSTGGAS